MQISKLQLLAIMPNARNRVDRFLPYLNRLLDEFHINTPRRVQHYLAQIAHESGELRYTREIASGWAYEGREDLGNTRKGDGVRFKGRGLIQITGRKNYEAYKDYCGFDVVGKPELLEQPLGAVRSSMWVFQKFGCNDLADQDDIMAITRRINGGLNGIIDRKMYLKRAKTVIR